jgi:uncharacterized repeat protein (TIGR01451 family)
MCSATSTALNDGQEVSPMAGSSAPVGLTPQAIRAAYGIDQITGDGTGQTIAIVDAYDNPAFVSTTHPEFASSDLHMFDVQFGLADPPSFLKVSQRGDANYPVAAGSTGWALETALDVEWAHAVAPGASILLVEADSPSYSDMMAAVDYARHATGVVAVSMSWGSSEFSGETSYDSYFTTPAGHTGVTFLASTGDDGSPGGFPAFSPNVVAVGGTTLTLSGNSYVSETAWRGSGGGQSMYESEPSYQSWAQQSGWRQTPDVSFVANPYTGVAVYDSYDYGSSPWVQVGGTSLSAPCWAGLVAMADQLRATQGLGSLDGRTQALPQIYSLPSSDFHDITSGNNGGLSAGIGYDEVTGRGSPVANLLVRDLAFFEAPDLTASVTHAADFKQGDVGNTYTIRVTNSGSGPTGGTVSLADLLPAGLTATAFSGQGWTTDLSTLTAIRNDVLAAGASYPVLTLTVSVAPDAPAVVTNTATVSGGGEAITANNTANDLTTVTQLVDLAVTMTHGGNFKQGDVGDTYTITVSNLGAQPTNGTVRLVDVLPAGLTATSLSGQGWTTDLATLTATRSDALAAGASYASLILVVNVAPNAPPSVKNRATVSGGGETNIANDTAADETLIAQVPDLVVTSSHSGDFRQGDVGDTYTLTVTNVGSAATTGTVRLVDMLPAGMTATSFSGQGWTTDLATLTATRSNSLAAGQSYPALVLTVNVAANVPSSVINTATVSGGGETNTANDTASDPTMIASYVNGLPVVAGTMPQLTGGTLPTGSTTLALYFNKTVIGAGTVANYDLRSSGPDSLLGTADDMILPLSVGYTGITATLGFTSLTPGVYRLTVRDAIFDTAGQKLDGDGDGVAGGNLVCDFVVNSAATGSLFSVPTTLNVGGVDAVTRMATGDFNSDGNTDLVTASENVVAVLLGNGRGGFSIATQYVPSEDLGGVAIGDFNRDGKLDVVTGQYGSGSLYISFGDGHGGFSRTTQIRLIAGYTCYMTVADFNRDGNLDIATADRDRTTVTMVLGTGLGTFSSPISFDSGSEYPLDIATGDFNSDGKIDLAVAHASSSGPGTTVLFGDGAGGFSTPTTVVSNFAGDSLAIADFNTDGKADLAVCDGNRRVRVLLGNGMGGFAPDRVFLISDVVAIAAYKLSAADFNCDGILDLATANLFSNTASVLLGDGLGGFSSPILFNSGGTSASSLALADFNNDGRCDLAVSNLRSTLGVLLNTCMASPVTLISPNGYSFDVTGGGLGAGQLVQGVSNAFDGVNRLQVGGSEYAPTSGSFTLADGNQTVLLPAVTMSRLTVSREITVPNAGGQDFARTVDVFENTTTDAISTTVRIVGNLGANGSLSVFATSDGDSIAEPTDEWIGLDDGEDGGGTPAIIQYIHGPAGLHPSSVVVTGDNVEWTYNLTVPGGATVRLAHFTLQDSTRTGVLAAANALVTERGFGGQATVFLSPAEVQSMANFDVKPPMVAATSPSAAAGKVIAGNHSLQVVFNEPVVGADAITNYELRSLGLDGLPGSADDTVVPLTVNYRGSTATLSFAALTEGVYRLTIREAITDAAGRQLDGNGDGLAGGDLVRDFAVIPPATSSLFGSATVTEAQGTTVTSVAAGDFNGDGKADLALTNGDNYYVTTMVGNGAGGFSSSTRGLTGGVNPGYVITSDFDADGNVDLGTGNNGLVGLRFGTGKGTFVKGHSYLGAGSGTLPVFMVAGDFNGDGNLDIVAANSGYSRVSVGFGNGVGSFPTYTGIDVGGLPSYLAAGDFNGDGRLDLVATISATQNVAILLNNGNTTLGSPVMLGTGGVSPQAVAVGDFNGDGNLDLAVVNSGDNNIAVLLGNGAGGFSSPVLFGTGGTSPQQVVVGDWNGDSRLDLAVTNSGSGNVGVLLGNGAGDFSSATTYSSGGTGPSAISVGDYNADGFPDLVIGNATSATVAVLLNSATYDDTIAPTVTEAKIAISGATGTGGVYRVGDTVTVAWNNTASGDNNTDIASVSMDFSQFGGPTVAATNHAGIWTASYTIVTGSIDTPNRNVSATATDLMGNRTTTTDDANAEVDNIQLTLSDAQITIAGTGSGTAGVYGIGDTLTVQWNSIATGNNSDIAGVTVDFRQFGGPAATAATNHVGVWTASYVITAGTIEAADLNVSVTATDDAGNVTTTTDTADLSMDNQPPTVLSCKPSTAGPINMGTLIFTVVFDSAVTNVTADDFQLTTTGTATGTIASVMAYSGSVFTVTINAMGGQGTLRLDLKGGTNVQDAAGNIALACTDGAPAIVDVAMTGEIHGTVWNDLDGDGVWDAEEPGQAGWQVYLDLNSNGQYDSGEPTATTVSDGSYAFTGLLPGTYTVAEVPQPGWLQTSPSLRPEPLKRVSIASNGGQADQESYALSINADGRYVAFKSFDSLLSGDTNGRGDIFVTQTIFWQPGTHAVVLIAGQVVTGGDFGNHAQTPTVAVDDAYPVDEDTPLIVAAQGVLANDTDPDNDLLSALLVAGPSHGSLTLNSDGSFTYQPAANCSGPDSFTYKVFDGHEYSNVATVVITVQPVNDPPTLTLTNQTTTLAENAGTIGRVKVAEISISDDALGENELTLAGGDEAMFEISDNVLYLKAGTSLDHETKQQLNVVVQVDDSTVGMTPDSTASLSITITDIGPTAEAGGPYTVSEGGTVVLAGSGQAYGGGSEGLAYAWDFDGDGQFDDATGLAPTFPASLLDGPGTMTIAMQVTEQDESNIDTAVVTITNVAPRITELTAPSMIGEGLTMTVSGRFQDGIALDGHTAMIAWGDGTSSPATVNATLGSFTASHPYKMVGQYMVTAIVQDDDGGVDQKSLSIQVVPHLGTIGFRTASIADLAGRDLWYCLETTREGYLTSEGLATTGGTLELELYDDVQSETPLATSVTTNERQRLDIETTAGKTYYLRVHGTGTGVRFCVANLVHHEGKAFDVFGAEYEDEFVFDPTSQKIAVNGLIYQIPDDVSVHFEGEAGEDGAVLLGTEGDDSAVLTATGGRLVGAGYQVTLTSIAHTAVYARGGTNSVYLYGTENEDTFTAERGQATLAGTGYSLKVVDFDAIHAIGGDGGDTAVLRDSAGAERLVAKPEDVRLYGHDFLLQAKGFSQVTAYATSGSGDRAEFYDSRGDDTLIASPETATLTGTGFSLTAAGFDTLQANASGGHDQAFLAGSTGRDEFSAYPQYSLLRGEGYSLQANHFGEVRADSQGGDDVARLYDSLGDDVFVGKTQESEFSGAGFKATAVGFAEVAAHALRGGQDTARLQGVLGSSTVTVTPHAGKLAGPGYACRVAGFANLVDASPTGATGTMTLAATRTTTTPFLQAGTLVLSGSPDVPSELVLASAGSSSLSTGFQVTGSLRLAAASDGETSPAVLIQAADVIHAGDAAATSLALDESSLSSSTASVEQEPQERYIQSFYESLACESAKPKASVRKGQEPLALGVDRLFESEIWK